LELINSIAGLISSATDLINSVVAIRDVKTAYKVLKTLLLLNAE
jgi:hypothetical protein